MDLPEVARYGCDAADDQAPSRPRRVRHKAPALLLLLRRIWVQLRIRIRLQVGTHVGAAGVDVLGAQVGGGIDDEGGAELRDPGAALLRTRIGAGEAGQGSQALPERDGTDGVGDGDGGFCFGGCGEGG